MRVTAEENPRGMAFLCLLDGADITPRAIVADDDEGWVDVCILSSDGKTLRTEFGTLSLIRLYGIVMIERIHHLDSMGLLSIGKYGVSLWAQ